MKLLFSESRESLEKRSYGRSNFGNISIRNLGYRRGGGSQSLNRAAYFGPEPFCILREFQERGVRPKEPIPFPSHDEKPAGWKTLGFNKEFDAFLEKSSC